MELTAWSHSGLRLDCALPSAAGFLTALAPDPMNCWTLRAAQAWRMDQPLPIDLTKNAASKIEVALTARRSRMPCGGRCQRVRHQAGHHHRRARRTTAKLIEELTKALEHQDPPRPAAHLRLVQKIRDDQGYWQKVRILHLYEHTNAAFTQPLPRLSNSSTRTTSLPVIGALGNGK